ncbi:hypothetical protein [uncultured Tateyamaria sp.]|uniref:hypothetical protein n=1 Tax=uncultured Tateyamaria sp. TaxID=455651 RepID=UPI00263521D7|nr:hypothetical protein [uncultured Tateyamaria sp.]
MRFGVPILMMFTLAACEEVVSEREGTFNYQGDIYRSVTREIARGDTTFERRTVYARPRPVSCSATDDLDCVAAIRSEWLDVR